MNSKQTVSRRAALKGLGATGAALAAIGIGDGAETPTRTPHPASRSLNVRKLISERVFQTPLIDTHEHLIEEQE